MSRTQKIAIDLVALGKALPEEFRKLRSLIERLSSAHSIHSDLAIALDMLDALQTAQAQAEAAIDQGASRTWQSDAALALLNSVIILYARATKTSSNHRGSVEFVKQFSATEIEAHQHLCRLRDDAIAHFGPGETLGGQTWHVEGVYVPLGDPDNLKIMTASRRIFKQRQLQDLARTQIERALGIAHLATRKRNSEVVDEMNRLLENERLHELAMEHYCDLAEFFGSEDEADSALARRTGSVTGAIRH